MTDFPITGGVDVTPILGGDVASLGVHVVPAIGGLWDHGMSGGVDTSATLGGLWKRGMTGGITSTVSMGGALLSRGIVVTTDMGGSFRLIRQESASIDADYYASGVRRTTPLIVKSLNAYTVQQLASLSNGDAFIVASDFTAAPGNTFYDAGAAAGYIGYYRRPGFPGDVVFRKPEDWEIVYSMTDGVLYRYNVSRESTARTWAPYRSMPQRALDGQQAFNAFDPDRVYDYVAQLIGGYLGQLQYDARIARTVRDPDLVPQLYLPAALENIGASIDPSVGALGDAAGEQTQRYYLSTTPVLNKYAGQNQAVRGRLKALGFVGYATVRWSKVEWPSLMVEATAMGAEHNIPVEASRIVVLGFTGGSTTSTARAIVTMAPQRGNALVGDQVGLTSYGTPSQLHRFTFIDPLGVSPQVSMGGGFTLTSTGITKASSNPFDPSVVQVNVGATEDESLENLRREIDTTGAFVVGPTIGIPGELTLDTPWCYKDYELLETPLEYWPSKFVTIHLNTLAGATYSPGNASEREAVRNAVTSSLYEDVLPVHARIAQWATDADAEDEVIEVTETFTIA